MGSKIRSRKIPHLIALCSSLLWAFTEIGFHSYDAEARPAIHELVVQAEFKVADDPLTTELIWKLDPDQLNPHRQRWLDHRKSRIEGLKALPRANGKFGVEGTKILSSIEAYFRGPGPWFQTYLKFSCSEKPDSWFETLDGAKKAAIKAGDVWVDLLRENQVKLSLLLGRIVGDTEKVALLRGEETFQEWIQSVDTEWRRVAPEQARKEEWEFYLEGATASGYCNNLGTKTDGTPDTTRVSKVPTDVSWKSMMEPPPADGGPVLASLLARAPVRLWNGLYSVRANVKVGGKSLNGRFLIDSGLNKSVISPNWLENQGIYNVWVEVPNAPPISVFGGDLWKGHRNLGRRASVDGIEVSGLDLPMKDFVLLETDFFGPPENAGSCCDGVLGRDFLNLYPTEFHMGPPAELKIWSKEKFHKSAETPWVEISHAPNGILASSCHTILKDVADQGNSGGGDSGLMGTVLNWMTGSQVGIRFHSNGEDTSWQTGSLQVACEGLTVAELPSTRFSNLLGSGSQSVDAGMPFLSLFKDVTFDLPHGRLWLSKELPIKNRMIENRSGLLLGFEFNHAERVLKVREVHKNAPSQSLLGAGLRAGMTITQIDSIAVEDLDLWEINRRLSGFYGDTVTVQWKTARKELKVAPLVVR